jgi:hypothetical protein
MVRPPAVFSFNYETIGKLTGLNYESLKKHRLRGNLNPDDLASVLLFIARHGTPELKKSIVDNALSRELPKKTAKVKRK